MSLGGGGVGVGGSGEMVMEGRGVEVWEEEEVVGVCGAGERSGEGRSEDVETEGGLKETESPVLLTWAVSMTTVHEKSILIVC